MIENNEAIYKSMSFAAVVNIIFGVLLIVTGLSCGILMLISGGKLLHDKSKMMF